MGAMIGSIRRIVTVLLATTALPSYRVPQIVAIALFVGSLAIVPARLRFAATMHRLPEYGLLVDASRKIVSMGLPMQEIATEFTLPKTSDPDFIYRILGGHWGGNLFLQTHGGIAPVNTAAFAAEAGHYRNRPARHR